MGIGENELEKLNWGKNVQPVKRMINDDDDDDVVGIVLIIFNRC